MRAVLWDMDGTLLDPNGSIRGALDAAIRHGGFSPFAEEEVLIGMPLRDILRTRTEDPAIVESMVEEFRRVSFEESWRLASWCRGVRDVVLWCRDQGWRVGIVTTKGEEEAKVLLEKIGDLQLFDTVVGDDDERPLKPDPAPVLEACNRLGVTPDRAIMIGDTRYDVEAGRAAGCPTIGVAWGHGSGSHGPRDADVVVDGAKALQAELVAWSHNP